MRCLSLVAPSSPVLLAGCCALKASRHPPLSLLHANSKRLASQLHICHTLDRKYHGNQVDGERRPKRGLSSLHGKGNQGLWRLQGHQLLLTREVACKDDREKGLPSHQVVSVPRSHPIFMGGGAPSQVSEVSLHLPESVSWFPLNRNAGTELLVLSPCHCLLSSILSLTRHSRTNTSPSCTSEATQKPNGLARSIAQFLALLR